MSPVEDLAYSEAAQADRRRRLLEQVTAASKRPKSIHIWPRGRTDKEAIDYVRTLVDAEGRVEIWGFGRTTTRQIKRTAPWLQFVEGFDISIATAVVEAGDDAPVRTGLSVGPANRVYGLDSQTG